MSYQSDWSYKDPNKPKEKWKPQEKKEVAKKKSRAKKSKNRSKDRKKYLTKCAIGFYDSKEWKRLRYRVLKKYGACCMCCGKNYKDDRVKIHVDHIKPRSKHPHLALDFENLQILCEDCNIGKSNLDDTDWRPMPETKDPDEILDGQCLAEARGRI